MRSDEQILAELRRVVAGLWLLSESDYPFEVFRWDGSIELGPRFLCEASGLAGQTSVRELTLEEFFGDAGPTRLWRAGAESGAPEPDHLLLPLLKKSLNSLRVYKVGEINILVFVVGRSVEGNWLGVSTRVVET
jgi:hypothetical protein